MPSDPEAKRGGVTAAVYLEVLQDELPTLWEPGLFFMQDNASIHTCSHNQKKLFADNAVEVVD